MKAVFADTSFFVAGLNQRDVHHQAARQRSMEFKGVIVTSEWVLLELANYFAASLKRGEVCGFIDSLRADPLVECAPATTAAFADGWAIYRQRLEKAWSLTDCLSLSIQIMQHRKIRQVLTSDHHFEQAGFEILLK